MRRGIPGRRSRAAGWARFFGGLALPVLVLTVAGSRVGVVPSQALEPVIVASFILGVAALALAGYALADIWSSGAEGLAIAIAGIVYASPVLAILGLVAAAAILYPPLTDVSTDPADPPRFAVPGTSHGIPDAERLAVQRTSYPNLVPHRYPLPLGDVYDAVHDVLEAKDWTITREQHPAFMPTAIASAEPSTQEVMEDEEVTKALALKSVMTQSRSGMATEARPDLVPEIETPFPSTFPPTDEATIEARAATPIFGFLDDVVLRLRITEEGTQVDMRSASRVGEHDLGQNARRIVNFFSALDARLQPEPAAGAAASQ